MKTFYTICGRALSEHQKILYHGKKAKTSHHQRVKLSLDDHFHLKEIRKQEKPKIRRASDDQREDHEIKSIFEHVEGYNAKRNEMILIVGIGMALRVSELVGLKVGDVYDGKQKQVKTHVTVRGETAKFNKN